jgi:predicted site-specific integrase-resolvase
MEGEQAGRCVLAYARVSTNKQKQDGNLARQIERLKAFCAEKYPGQPVKVISEVGSGLSDTRPGFLKMVEMLAAGKLSALVVEWQDRCARFGVGVVKRLCEAKGTAFIETHTGTVEEQALTAEQEMSRDILSIVTVFANKASGKKGGMAVKIVPPPEFRDFVVGLAGSGMSRRDILKEVQKRKFHCQNTGKELGERAIRNIVDNLPAVPVVPSSVKTFVARRVVGASKRETTANLYTAYVVHCGTLKTRPLTRDKMTDYLKQAVTGLRLENDKVTTAYGICLRSQGKQLV